MDADRGDFIVVGVDQSDDARAALDFALDEGVAHGEAVEVVSAWLWSSAYEGMARIGTLAEGQGVVSAFQQRVIASAVAERAVSPVISRTVVHASAGPALVERAEGARLLVVGSARRGALMRAALGSVSEYCVRHAPVPVVVVADPRRIERRTAAPVEPVPGS